VSLAAFSVVVPRPSRAVGRYLVPPMSRRLVPVGRVGFPARPWPAWASGPTPGRPMAGDARARDLALRSGLGRCCGRGFACYVWDPVTTAGAAGRGSGQAPAGFRGHGAGRPARLSARPASSGLPGRGAGSRAGLCLSLAPARSCSLSRLSYRPCGAGCPGVQPWGRLQAVQCCRARNREGAVGLPLGMSNNA
jgi:hypothetical protein